MDQAQPRDGLALVRRVAQALNQDVGPEAILLDVAAALRDDLGLEGATIWRRAPNATRIETSAVPATGATAESLDALPEPPPGAVRVPIVRADHRLGVLELVPADPRQPPDLAVAEVIAAVLAQFLDAVLLTEDLAEELATRARELQEQRRFTNLVIDSLPVGLYVVDRDYRIRVWNRKRETGTQGLRRDQVMGRRIFDVLTRQPAGQMRSELDQIFSTGELVQMELDVESRGEPSVFRLTRIPMTLDGSSVTHVITIGEDVTEQRQSEQRIRQSEKLAAVGQLAAGVMHEINNPLATIGACVPAIQARLEGYGDATVTEYLEIIDTEVQRCTGIVDQLLDFSRHRSGHGRRGAADLNALVEQTLFLLKHHSRFKRLTVERHLLEGLPPVLVNAERVIQAFMAVLLNAADAMDQAGVLRVRTAWSAQRPGEVVAEFEDTGKGIAPSDLEKIFEPFYTTKPPGRGTGLGLTICYGIVEEQDGRITAHSEQGVGTTFRIFLPVAAEAGAA